MSKQEEEEEENSGDYLHNDKDDNDLILSQDFFCTPDYITPEDQILPNGLDSNAEESIPCPNSPEKPKAVRNKRLRSDEFNSLDKQLEELAKGDFLGLDEIESDISLGTNSPKKHDYCSSMTVLGCVSRYMASFREFKQIGSGNFGCVFRVMNRLDGCFYAMKKCTKSENAAMEVKTMASVGFHDHVVGYYTSWTESDQLYIQMELCDHNLSMVSSSKLYTELEVLPILHQIAKALKFIHEKGIVHLDVKPDNIYVKKGIYKLGDFGCATFLDKMLSIEEGDARYIAHEILNENFDNLDKADIFSLGATIYELVRDKVVPLSGSLSLDLHEGKFPLIHGCTPEFQELLKAMVDPDPVRRPSAIELLQFHSFCKS